MGRRFSDRATIDATGDELVATFPEASECLDAFLAWLTDDLDAGPAALAKISNTRAIDGTLTDEISSGYELTWNYHPDDGLNVVIERP